MKYQINKGSKSYGGNSVFEQIQFEIRNTEKIAVVGRNGCGKTTLLNIIGGLDKGNGTIYYDDNKISKYDSKLIDLYRNYNN